jgi:2,3-dihydroxybenzoate decarboxylase
VQENETLVDRLRSVGVDRVVYSADYSYENDLEMAAWFDRAVLNGRTKRNIGFENARVLLKSGGQTNEK